jgi:hypothetical protein
VDGKWLRTRRDVFVDALLTRAAAVLVAIVVLLIAVSPVWLTALLVALLATALVAGRSYKKTLVIKVR